MRSKNNGKDFCMFALPGMFCFFAVLVLPFVYGVYLTLTDWNGVAKVKNFIGLKNFAGVVKDGQFWTSLLLTFKYVIFVVLIVNVLAFAIAYLLTRGMKGQNFFRAGFFTPNLIGGIVLGYIWQFVFSRVFVSIGESTGWRLFEVSWLSDPTNAFIALVVVSVWQLSGYMILIYVAGFMGLSEDVMEAASIDGASGFIKLKNIIMPLMMSSITICLFLTLSRAFMVYDVNLSLTAGAPYGTTEMAAMHVYEKAFTSRQFGVGQAEALILFIIVAAISGLQVYFTKKQEAAYIDGCTHSQTFFKIVLPLLKPIISTMVILNSLAFWNDFLLPSLVLTDKKLLTLPLSTYSFYGTYSADYGTIMAGLLLCVIPILILYVVLQKQIIGGVVAGAVK